MAATLLAALICWPSSPGFADELRRASVWDLKIGQPISAQPVPDEFRGFACGSNGGPPRRRLAGWSDYVGCRPEANGLHEVYFEYDDEYEYVARARDLPREIARWSGTTETGFPVVVSALFDDTGVLAAIRIVTNSRPDYRNEVADADVRKRADAHLFGQLMAARFDIDPATQCRALPAAEGEVRDRVHFRQTILRSDGFAAWAQGDGGGEFLSQARPERNQPATVDAIDARPVRELGAGGNPPA